MEPQSQKLMELQTQQPTEDGGSNQAAGSSANMPFRQSSIRWTPTPDQIRILKELYYDKGAREKQKKRLNQGVQVPKVTSSSGVGGSIDLNFGSTSSTNAGGSIDLNFGSASSTGAGGSIDLNFGSWVDCSVDPYSSSPFNTNTTTTSFGTKEEQTFMEQRGEDHQEIETLPLFPMHGEDILGNLKTTSEGGSGYGYYSCGSGGYNGGSHISLELSLNPSGAADLA
ncbi:protein WUSCHEL [Rosa chinensis]|uniref:protein WUSCHEL n=1 Tax=Rosa chinensis TaxID=74649 RepID=UPI001AD8B0E4|nr:protein WUSCHEL [Rosa chinensis]